MVRQENNSEQRKALLFGLGLDGKDGHVRLTRGKNFRVLGGSQSTHELMQEKMIKFNEHLDHQGKHLEEISHQEFHDLADKVGMNVVRPDRQSEDKPADQKDSN